MGFLPLSKLEYESIKFKIVGLGTLLSKVMTVLKDKLFIQSVALFGHFQHSNQK